MHLKTFLLSIILILPLVAQATSIQTAETSITKHDIFDLREKIQYFKTEYGYYPPSEIPALFYILQGREIRGYNWRKIVFWQPRPEKKGWFSSQSGSFNSGGELVDGWNRPFIFDIDPTTGKIEIWSKGEKGTWDKAKAMGRYCGTVLIDP